MSEAQQHVSPAGAAAFDSKAEGWDDRPLVKELAAAAAKVLKAEVVHPGDDVLDVGCGTGLLSGALADRAAAVTGCDASTGMVQAFRAKQRRGELPRNVDVVLADLTETDPLGERRFDVATSVMTFHHLPDIPAMLAVMVRHLKPGGRVAVFDFMKTPHSHRFHPKSGHHGVFHEGGFALEEMQKYLEGAGLCKVSARVVHEFKKPAGDCPEEVLDFQLLMALGEAAP